MNNTVKHVVEPNTISGFNMPVKTPLGMGRSLGRFLIKTAHEEGIAKGVLVRLPVNDDTRPHLNRSNCITPKAVKSGLWVFPESELGQGLVEFLMFLAFVAVVIFAICRNWPW